LTFGEEDQFLHFLGGYFAVFSVPNYLGLQEHMLSYAESGQTVAVYPVWGTGQLRVLLLFRTLTELDYDRHDRAAQVRMVRGLYSGAAWEVPRLLEELENADDFYLDSISQVRMDTWTKGRVTLVGDAAYSPGPAVGGGTSLAVLGAYALAAELAAAPDLAAGLAASEDAIRSAVQASRNIGPTVLKMMIPESKTQIWAMAQAIRSCRNYRRPCVAGSLRSPAVRPPCWKEPACGTRPACRDEQWRSRQNGSHIARESWSQQRVGSSVRPAQRSAPTCVPHNDRLPRASRTMIGY
jgi:hypothetical protein